MGSVVLSLYSMPSRVSASVNFNAIGFSAPEGSTSQEDVTDDKGGVTHYTVTTSYSSPIYVWAFSDGGGSNMQSGIYTFYNLPTGEKSIVYAGVKVTCTKTVTKEQTGYDPPKEEEAKPEEGGTKTREGEVPATETIDLGSAIDSINVWTKPYNFSLDLPDWGWTDSWLTKTKWNEFINAGSQYLSWQSQSDKVMTNIPFPADGHIGAQMFNNAASQLGVLVRVSEGDRIRASLFRELTSNL